jgi:hypothetical protein
LRTTAGATTNWPGHNYTSAGSNQFGYLQKYLNQMERALHTNNWLSLTGTNHNSNYLDVDSFVDFHWVVEYTKIGNRDEPRPGFEHPQPIAHIELATFSGFRISPPLPIHKGMRSLPPPANATIILPGGVLSWWLLWARCFPFSAIGGGV